MARLVLMVPLALVLIFILLYLNFRSVRPVLLILANIPLALVGGVLGLKLSGLYLSVSASVGFIALFGFMAIAPNQARVLLLFGAYKGSALESGFETRCTWLLPMLNDPRIGCLDCKPLKDTIFK